MYQYYTISTIQEEEHILPTTFLRNIRVEADDSSRKTQYVVVDWLSKVKSLWETTWMGKPQLLVRL